MTRINDFELSIAIKIAADRCLADDVDRFMALDIKNTVVDPRVEKRVSRKLKFDEWKNVRRISAGMLKYAAIALASAVSLFFALSMTIQPVRAAFFGAIVTWYEDFIDVRYGEDVNDTANDDIIPAKMNYIPDGWIVSSEHKDKVKYSCAITDTDIGCVIFSQSKDYENGTKIDNGTYFEEIVYLKEDTIEANLFIYENDQYILLWKDTYMFMLESRNIELDELIEIANGIK